MKINILLCDTFPGLLPSFIPSYVSMFTLLFDRIDTDLEYQIFPAWEGILPTSFHQGELYLITGSNSGAYEQKAWIESLLEWIRQAYSQQVKLVGICFGHQIIAQALGGEVQKATQGWGIGVRTSDLLTEDTKKYFPNSKMNLLYNHHDQVIVLPPNAVRLATSRFCTNECFQIDNCILTFQGHPEYTPEYAKHLIINHASDEPQNIKTKALNSLDTQQHHGSAVAKWILDFAR